jgi:porphobilinogen synthase
MILRQPFALRQAQDDKLRMTGPLIARPRRLRTSPAMRALVRETRVNPDGLVQPLFVVPGSGVVQPIGSMPGVSRYSVDAVVRECGELDAAGVRAVLLFGIPDSAEKDAYATVNHDPNGIVQRAARAIKEALPHILVIADLCNCEYTDHGHCGILDPSGDVDNDLTLEVLAKTALTYARSGVDIVAPSDMMDGRVAAIRRALDDDGFTKTAIMSYAAKYASAFYGPFREAADSTPSFGDRRSYQMDPANVREALKEVRLDIEEGADIVMVKPAMAYLDVVRAVRETTDLPVAVYHVSGEYAMIKAAAERGWIDEERAVDETLTAIARAGADIIITYFAKDYLRRVRV